MVTAFTETSRINKEINHNIQNLVFVIIKDKTWFHTRSHF